MLFPLLLVLASPFAAAQVDTTLPSSAETQAEAAMAEAWNARRRVLHALCGEDARERRLRDADARFQTANEAYRTRFGHSWIAPGDTSLRQWECTFPDGFEWTLASYHNALTGIDGALAR